MKEKLKERWLLLLFALPFASAGIGILLLLMEEDVPAFMAWIFTLLGGIAFFSCLKSLFTSLLIQLDHNGLVSERLWFGIIVGKDKIPRAEIVKLQLDLSYRSKSSEGHTEMYKIHALTRSGKKIIIAMNLKGRDTAQLALESIASLTGYKCS